MRVSGGFLKNQLIKVPKGGNTRPSSSLLRQSIFNILYSLDSDIEVLDLFSGSGAMGIEAISRGAGKVVFVENNKHAITVIKENLQRLGIRNLCTVIFGDVLKSLKSMAKERFDIIYIDPPYANTCIATVLQLIDAMDLLKKGGTIFVEKGKRSLLDIPKLHNLLIKDKRQIGDTQLFRFCRSKDL